MKNIKIEKKIWPEYFEEIKSGKKKFELRLADFRVKLGVYKFWPRKDVQKYGYQIIQIN